MMAAAVANVVGGGAGNTYSRVLGKAMLSRNCPRRSSGIGFQLHTREIDRVVVVEAVGRLTSTDGHTQLRDLIHVFTGNGVKKIILNFARVEFIDRYGIGEMARCCSIVRRTGGEIKLAGVKHKVLDALEISRMNTLFEIYPAESAAHQAFGQRI